MKQKQRSAQNRYEGVKQKAAQPEPKSAKGQRIYNRAETHKGQHVNAQLALPSAHSKGEKRKCRRYPEHKVANRGKNSRARARAQRL